MRLRENWLLVQVITVDATRAVQHWALPVVQRGTGPDATWQKINFRKWNLNDGGKSPQVISVEQ